MNPTTLIRMSLLAAAGVVSLSNTASHAQSFSYASSDGRQAVVTRGNAAAFAGTVRNGRLQRVFSGPTTEHRSASIVSPFRSSAQRPRRTSGLVQVRRFQNGGGIWIGDSGVAISIDGGAFATAGDGFWIGTDADGVVAAPLPMLFNDESPFHRARSAFINGDLAKARRQINAATRGFSPNEDALQLKSLILLHQQDYLASADAAYQALAIGRVWNWRTLSKLYRSTEKYEAQLRRLQRLSKSKPESKELRFVLGYHYIMLGHFDAARGELNAFARLVPEDRETQQMVERVVQQLPPSLAPAPSIAPDADPDSGE